MTLWSTLFPDRNLLSRQYFNRDDGVIDTIAAPEAATIIRVSASGGGNAGDNPGGLVSGQPGGSAAFARVKAACTGGEEFSVQVGLANRYSVATAAGLSVVKRLPSGTVICQADHGLQNAGGLVANSVGDVRRAGSRVLTQNTAPSPGDDEDPYPLGFGGPGGQRPYSGNGNRWMAAYYGGAGWWKWPYYIGAGGSGYAVFASTPAGGGLVCVEFFRTDPGY